MICKIFFGVLYIAMKEKLNNYIFMLFMIALFYVAISSTYYRFSHPELTETQLFLKIIDAMLWRN